MLKIINPATEELLHEVLEDSDQSIKDKFMKSRNAQKAWAQKPLSERKKPIERFANALGKYQESLAITLSQEMGKPVRQARNEVQGTQKRIQFFLDHVEEAMREEKTAGGKITWEPLGVIANISAWNYPYFVGSNVFIPALLTGNSVIYKPSEYATLTGLEIAKLFSQAGLPEDLFSVIIGGGGAGAKLLELPFPAVFFTGSYTTGQKIAVAAAKNLMKLNLELGGKDPCYVCEDVDMDKVLPQVAEGVFYNAGQGCCAIERLYVHEKIHDRFAAGLVDQAKALKIGDPLRAETDLGPLARKVQLDYLAAQVEDALSKGAKLLLGGERMQGMKGFYFAPTILMGCNHDMKIMREENFGPVIGIMSVKNDEEAYQMMSDTDYGLTASVYTKNAQRADGILSRLEVGTAYWNCCDRVSAHLPWSGRRHSGIGLTLSRHGFREFLHPKAWHEGR